MIVGSGKKRSETVGNRSETVYSGRKLSETVGKTVGKGRKRSEKVWKSLNLDSILSEKSGNNPETIQKKSGKNPVLEFSHILLFQVFLGPFPDLSRFFPGFIQKNRKRLEKLSEKVGKTVGKGRKKSEKVGKGQKTSEKVGKGRIFLSDRNTANNHGIHNTLKSTARINSRFETNIRNLITSRIGYLRVF